MNKLNQQKFLSLFNEMLTDTKGTTALKNVLELGAKGDEMDNLNAYKEQNLSMRLDQRNILFLKKVEEAKQKILDGTYGDCEDCGATISQKRLLARPTASLCISCQEEKERSEFGNFNKRRDLTSKNLSDENDGYIRENKVFSSVGDIGFESVVDL